MTHPDSPSPDPNTGAAHHARAWVAWFSLPQLIAWGSVFYTFALLVEPLERDLGLGRGEVSLAFSIALLVEGLLAFVLGRWIDAGHERAVMTGGSLLLGLGLAWHARVSSALELYAVWALLGAGLSATLYNAAFAVLTRRFPQDYRRAIITLTFLGGLASTVFIPLSSWLIHLLGWRNALLCLAAGQLLLCAPLHAWLLRHAPARRVASHANAPALKQQLRSRSFLAVGAFIVLTMGVTSALPAHIVSLLREQGFSPAWAVAIPASIGLIQVLGRVVLYVFEHRMSARTSDSLIPWLLPLALLVLLLASGKLGLASLFVLLWGLGNGMLTIVKGTAIARYVGQTHVASLNGALGLPLALARAGAPLMLGLLWTPSQGYTWGLALMLVLSLAAIAALAAAQRWGLAGQ